MIFQSQTLSFFYWYFGHLYSFPQRRDCVLWNIRNYTSCESHICFAFLLSFLLSILRNNFLLNSVIFTFFEGPDCFPFFFFFFVLANNQLHNQSTMLFREYIVKETSKNCAFFAERSCGCIFGNYLLLTQGIQLQFQSRPFLDIQILLWKFSVRERNYQHLKIL